MACQTSNVMLGIGSLVLALLSETFGGSTCMYHVYFTLFTLLQAPAALSLEL